MANSISISSNMNDVYIVDSNNKLIFSNSLSGNGAIISLNSNDELLGAAAQSTFPGTPLSKSITNAQWTLTYSAATKTLYIIGVTDETIGYIDGDGISLDGKSIQIKLNGTTLELTTS